MKKIEITLRREYTSNDQTHTTFSIMMRTQKVGELVHRHSKDTYSVNFEANFQMLDAEHFRTMVHPFNVLKVEKALTMEFSKLLTLMTA